MIQYTGKIVSKGIAIGPVMVMPEEIQDVDKVNISDVDEEIKRFEKAICEA